MASKFHEKQDKQETPGWIEYMHALNIRFGDKLDSDPMAEPMNIKRTGSVQAYLDKFDGILNRAQLLEEYTVSRLVV